MKFCLHPYEIAGHNFHDFNVMRDISGKKKQDCVSSQKKDGWQICIFYISQSIPTPPTCCHRCNPTVPPLHSRSFRSVRECCLFQTRGCDNLALDGSHRSTSQSHQTGSWLSLSCHSEVKTGHCFTSIANRVALFQTELIQTGYSSDMG